MSEKNIETKQLDIPKEVKKLCGKKIIDLGQYGKVIKVDTLYAILKDVVKPKNSKGYTGTFVCKSGSCSEPCTLKIHSTKKYLEKNKQPVPRDCPFGDSRCYWVNK